MHMRDLQRLINELRAQGEKIERAVETLTQMQVAANGVLQTQRKKRGRKGMTPEERRDVSHRMSLYWAQRREEQGRPR